MNPANFISLFTRKNSKNKRLEEKNAKLKLQIKLLQKKYKQLLDKQQ